MTRRARGTTGLGIGLMYWLLGGSLSGQEIVYKVPGSGMVVANVGDITGDGLDDFLVPVFADVRVHSGANGALVRTHRGTDSILALAGGGDFSGDGVPDYAIGFQGRFTATYRIFSGQTGDLLFQIDTRDAGQLAFPGDLDGDGFSEVAVGAVGKVYSSRDQSVLYSYSGFFGAVGSAGDLNHDGVGDLFWADRSTREAVAISGATGSEWMRYGSGVTFVSAGGDADADGTPDLLVIAGDTLHLLSGANGSILGSWSAISPALPSFVGDVDQDGHDDLAISKGFDGAGSGKYLGTVTLISGRTTRELYRFVDEDSSTFSLGWGATPFSDLNADGHPELLLGGLAGTRVVEGASLYLNIWPRIDVESGEDVSFTTSGGVPGNLALMFVVRVNGDPFTFHLAGGFFDGDSVWQRSVLIPAGLAGLDVGYRVFTIDSAGKVEATAEETIRLR